MPLTPPDPEQIGLGARIFGAVATFAGVVVGFFTLRHKGNVSRQKEKEALDGRINSKAEKADVGRLREDVKQLFIGQERAREKVSDQMREDKTEILSAIGEMTGSFQSFRADVMHEFGQRPSRAEIGEMVEDKIGAAMARRSAHG